MSAATPEHADLMTDEQIAADANPAPYEEAVQDELEGSGGPGDAPRTPEQAIDYGLALMRHHTFVEVGYCLRTVRTDYGVGPLYLDATEAWAGADKKHRTSNPKDIPRGVPAFWTGGSAGHGHIVLSVGGGICLTTDFHESGYVDLARIDRIGPAWGLNLVGWTEDLNGVTVWTDKPDQPAPHPGPRDGITPRLSAAIKTLAMLRGDAFRAGHKQKAKTITAAIKLLKDIEQT